MFVADSTRYELVGLMQQERLSHAALLQKVARERSSHHPRFNLLAARGLTARRLAARFAGGPRLTTESAR